MPARLHQFGGKEIPGIYLKRFFPRLLSRVIRNYTIENRKVG